MQLNRRTFLTLTATTATATMMNTLESFATPYKSDEAPGYKLLVFATNWGYTGSWDQFCSKIKAEGYDGVEAWYPADANERKVFLEAFQKHDLKFGLLVGSGEADYNKHLDQFKTNLSAAAQLKPVYINCHSGRDHFSSEQNQAFIDVTTNVAATTGVPVYHETHRSRILYAAPIAKQFMDKNPKLRLTLDISHWCCVHESLLEDQRETISLALKRTDHIHARIGHPEGPQVNDPRAPEWKHCVEAHFAWWDTVVAQKKSEGKVLTMLTEFGPVDYMPALPFSRQPVADQWAINKHMLDLLRTRYGS